ncbi:DUF3991 and TOPRIM domain-containing protein [Plastoroseomonas hellenica]|uniref:DUF3991 and TOPRIM domain-containing protein n=1 Tax=Plastoroseomonas hellenica TaxID=2687306 RepID=UPI002013470B|nr:DUF3991 and TOPRIM domain-containing protein [Plastoroseomonas hellenica]
MSGHDPELKHLRDAVHCAALLENLAPPWQLDRAGSTRDCLKYRRGRGEIIIVNHGGRGWWDAGGTARGDIFALVQHLRPDLNFGHVRKLLRDFVGLRPAFAPHQPARQKDGAPPPPAAERWGRAQALRQSSRAWRYLSEERALPSRILHAAAAWDSVREGGFGSAWFAHRDHRGKVTGFEMRGREFRGFVKGGEKTLFQLPGWIPHREVRPRRIVVAEAPIDALSVAARERLAGDTLYVATGGGMGPRTIDAIDQLLAELASIPAAALALATDNDPGGERYAGMLSARARAVGVGVEDRRPPADVNDWNDDLRRGGAHDAFASGGATPIRCRTGTRP